MSGFRISTKTLMRIETGIVILGVVTVAVALAFIVVGLTIVDPRDRVVVGSRAQGAVGSPVGRPAGDPASVPATSGCCPTRPVASETKGEAADQATAGDGETPSETQTAGLSPAASLCTCSPCRCLNKTICDRGLCKQTYIVAFGATWCGACQAQKPMYEALRKSGVTVIELDADVHKGAVAAAKPRIFPTLIIYMDGSPVERIEGTTSIDFVKGKL